MSAATCEHLLEALPLVEALGEAETGAGDRRQRLAPPHEVAGEVVGRGVAHDGDPTACEHGPFDLGAVVRCR